MPLASIAMLGFTAAKNGIAISARKVGFARLSRIVSVGRWRRRRRPSAALPSVRSSAPTTSWMNAIAGDPCCWFAARSNARLKAAAVTAEPSLKRRPGLIVNVYVRPSRETRGKPVAASGTSREPSGAGLSG